MLYIGCLSKNLSRMSRRLVTFVGPPKKRPLCKRDIARSFTRFMGKKKTDYLLVDISNSYTKLAFAKANL